VSNVTFTPAAQALGQKGGVALLHHSELDRLEEMTAEAQQANKANGTT
jgi:hypothetical protein